MNIEVKKSTKAIDYEKSMQILEQRVKDVIAGKKSELLWILEHKNVYTAGSSSINSDLLDKNINVIKTNRGGKHTFHGPGQKIVYFVLDLNKRGKNIRNLVNSVEACIVNTLKEYNVSSYSDRKNIGIWTSTNQGTYKIAAIGIKVKRWIAYHGFALNISTDLTKYKAIIPCGLKNKKITSLKEMGIKNIENINKIIIKNFLNTFL
jgi:lipoyl(octanoyl) transferase